MLTRKTTIIAFMTIMIALVLFPCATHKIANAPNEKYQDFTEMLGSKANCMWVTAMKFCLADEQHR